jgi:hypothetical protein
MTISELHDRMREMDRIIAPGSESTQMQDFGEDCYRQLGAHPSSDRAAEMVVPDSMIEHWTAIAEEAEAAHPDDHQ